MNMEPAVLGSALQADMLLSAGRACSAAFRAVEKAASWRTTVLERAELNPLSGRNAISLARAFLLLTFTFSRTLLLELGLMDLAREGRGELGFSTLALKSTF